MYITVKYKTFDIKNSEIYLIQVYYFFILHKLIRRKVF